MSNLGSYQDLTMDAFDAGGPEAYLEEIRQAGVAEGRAEGGLVGAIVALISTGLGIAATWKVCSWQSRKKEKTEALKAELLKVEAASVDAADEGDDAADAKCVEEVCKLPSALQPEKQEFEEQREKDSEKDNDNGEDDDEQ